MLYIYIYIYIRIHIAVAQARWSASGRGDGRADLRQRVDSRRYHIMLDYIHLLQYATVQ